MKNLYIVTDGITTSQFTNKRKAEKLLKDLEKAGKPATIATTTYYPQSFIDLMKYQYRVYKNSNTTDITQAYKTNPSWRKVNSFNRIKNSVLPGTIKVISHTAQHYSTGSLVTDPETGELLFRYDTKCYVRVIPLSLVES